jgi:RNA polymerase sigma-70 factor (ECF subfamily)
VRDPLLTQLEEVYRSEFRRFLRVATAIIGDEERALDAVQEGFARAVRHRGRFRGEGSFAGWLWHTVVNAARKERARRPDPVLAAVPDEVPESPAPVRAAVAALPERQRLVLFLRYYADLDYRAIAEALEISPGTVGATLNAAHATLRRQLQEVSR